MSDSFNSCLTKTICRTCTTAASSYLSLREEINNNQNQTKTYDELLGDLLQVKRIIPLENLLPNKICAKCAHFLKNIYKFILEARKRHEELLQHLQTVHIENDLPERHNELVKVKKEQIKIEPYNVLEIREVPANDEQEADDTQNMLLKPIEEVNIKKEMEMSRSECSPLEDGNENNDSSVKCELYDNDLNVEEYNYGDESMCTDTSGASSIAEDDQNEDDNLLIDSLDLSCDTCDELYGKETALKRHKTYNHMPEDQKISCTLCTFKTSRVTNMKDHLRTLHGTEKVTDYSKRFFSCTLCPKRYSRKSDLQRHTKKTHFSDQRNKSSHLCSFCGKSCINKQKLMIHIRIHTGDRPFKCDFCEKAFRSSESLKYHLITHSDEKPHICSQCDKSFKHKDKLRAHMRLHTVDKPFKCELCEKAFRRSESLKYHLVIYHNERPHVCLECGKSFKKKDNLHVHMRVHSGLRPYMCNVCERTFKYLSGLKSHMPVHTGQKPFSCKSCNKSFARKTNLSAHCKKIGHDN